MILVNNSNKLFYNHLFRYIKRILPTIVDNSAVDNVHNVHCALGLLDTSWGINRQLIKYILFGRNVSSSSRHFLLSSNQFSSKFPMSVSPGLATTHLRVIRPWCHGSVMTCSHHVAGHCTEAGLMKSVIIIINTNRVGVSSAVN